MTGYPHRLNLLFAVPHTGRAIPLDVMYARLSMATPMNYNMMLQVIKGSEVGEARQQLAEMAVAQNAKFMFFWDEDVACPPHSIPELVYKMEQHPEIAVCGGIYCLKRKPAEPLVFRGNGNGPYWDWKAGEFFEVSGIGMGCTLIRVDCFKDLKKPWFRTVSDYSRMLDGTAGLEQWTEDLWFCDRVTKTKKWKVYADASLLCKHYNMDTGEAFELPADSNPVKHLRVPKGTKKILDIGSGATYTSDQGKVVSVDFDEECHPDYRCDLTKLPFGNEEFDAAFSPALERFSSDRTASVLEEWKRVLKSKGEMRIITADFDYVSRQIVAGKADARELFRKIRLNAFTRESLKRELENAGFDDVKPVPADEAHIAYRSIKK